MTVDLKYIEKRLQLLRSKMTADGKYLQHNNSWYTIHAVDALILNVQDGIGLTSQQMTIANQMWKQLHGSKL